METTRAAAFEALGSLSKFATGAQLDTFMEQVSTDLFCKSCNFFNNIIRQVHLQHLPHELI